MQTLLELLRQPTLHHPLNFSSCANLPKIVSLTKWLQKSSRTAPCLLSISFWCSIRTQPNFSRACPSTSTTCIATMCFRLKTWRSRESVTLWLTSFTLYSQRNNQFSACVKISQKKTSMTMISMVKPTWSLQHRVQITFSMTFHWTRSLLRRQSASLRLTSTSKYTWTMFSLLVQPQTKQRLWSLRRLLVCNLCLRCRLTSGIWASL